MPPLDPEERKDPDHRIACILDLVSRVALLKDRTPINGVLNEIGFERWEPQTIQALFRVVLELGMSEDRDAMTEAAAKAIRKAIRENAPLACGVELAERAS
jgi:hypothetical protein